VSTFPYCCLDRSLEAVGALCISGERFERIFAQEALQPNLRPFHPSCDAPAGTEHVSSLVRATAAHADLPLFLQCRAEDSTLDLLATPRDAADASGEAPASIRPTVRTRDVWH